MNASVASKIVSMQHAIAEHVPSGAMVMLGAQLEQMIPFAAGHEIIRQGRRDLTLVGPISDILFDQMIGAGCVSRVMAAWVGNASAGMGYCFRRAVEKRIPRAIETVDHTNLTIALALHAGAMGVPFMPTYTTLGSDLLKRNGNLREFSSPVNEDRLVAVRALRPDVAIVHVQRADAAGSPRAHPVRQRRELCSIVATADSGSARQSWKHLRVSENDGGDVACAVCA